MKKNYIFKILSSKMLVFKKINFILTPREASRGFIFLFLMIIGMIFETLGIGMIAPLIHVISDPTVFSSNSDFSVIINFLNIESYRSLVITFSIGIVGIYIIKNCFLVYFSWYKIQYLTSLRMNLGNRIFKIYLSKPYSFHLAHNSGQLIQNVSTEVTIFTGRFLAPSLVIFTESLIVIGIISLLLFLEPLGTIILIMFLGLIAKLILSATRKHIQKWGKERQYHDGKKIQHLQQGLGGIKDALLLGRIQFFLNRYKRHNLLSTKPDQKQSFLQEIPRLWIEVLAILGFSAMALVMVIQDNNTTKIISILGVFGAAAFRLMPSVTRIIASIQSLRYSGIVLDSLYKEFSHTDMVDINNSKDYSHTNNFTKLSTEINISNITFKYEGTDKPSLLNVSLKIPIGKSIGLMGSSGSGKSTLVDILLGLLKPDSGNIMVDGQNINVNTRSWQNQVGYVPQSIYLIDSSLRNNIAYGVEEDSIDDRMIERVIRSAHLSDFVESLPEGINTYVGERGVRLSGGQKQRIGIARALYSDPDIIVLDEASSSLDNKTEKQIMNTVDELHLHKTILIVAHRLTTLEKCDWIYKLENGKIVEEGEPSSMLK
jgi:ATP-binding cassette, subfamily B, bacterial PglK